MKNYRDGANATLTGEPTSMDCPVGFGIDPSGRWLLAANQSSDTVVVFAIDAATGKLKPTGQSIEVGSPVSVAFAPSR